jgi:hypothetical protein
VVIAACRVRQHSRLQTRRIPQAFCRRLAKSNKRSPGCAKGSDDCASEHVAESLIAETAAKMTVGNHKSRAGAISLENPKSLTSGVSCAGEDGGCGARGRPARLWSRRRDVRS